MVHLEMQVSRKPLFTSLWSCKGVALFPYIAFVHPYFIESGHWTSDKEEAFNTRDKQIINIGGKEIKLPDPPTNCCMSGCQNCVWLAYADELKKTVCSSPEENLKIILEHITDPNMKAFLKFEMSHLIGECKYRPNDPESPDN